MNKLYIMACGILMLFITVKLDAQNIKKNLKGSIVDSDSKQALIGVTLYIKDSDPLIGTISDANGNFVFKELPIGRHTVVANYIGYETKAASNILLGSGKEVFIKMELTESLTQIDEVVVKAHKNKGQALNEMATVSARSFTVEETKRYAGTFNDPARMVSSFAGVVGNPTGENDIVVRGNSPKGILWRLEGVEIPNPNHFANEGYSGGPINALNSAMLDNSDFFTSAFAPEYGNAYSGVFDMKLRTGNNEKREYSLSAGALGFDGTAEGPLKVGYGGSYLVNYRYSSLAVLDELGIVDFFGIPKYQDLSFKINLPAGKAGYFSIFGLGGKSSIYQEDRDEENEDYVHQTGNFGARLGVAGLNHMVALSSRVYIKTSLTASGTGNESDYQTRNDQGEFYEAARDDYTNSYLRASSCINFKANAKHRIKGGVTYTALGYNMFEETDFQASGQYDRNIDASGNSGLLQAYINWKYRFTDNLTLVSGIHTMQFFFNDSYSIEPRLGLNYKLNSNGVLSAGLGIHSKVESLATYNAQTTDENGNITIPNEELGLTKSAHFVGGYQHQFSENLRFKGEIYYQHLYDVPVENDATSPYVYNNESGGWTTKSLVNEGSGRNYGLELTLERFYSKRFYYLITGSIYNSKFTALDNVERNSRFNGNYTGNILIGKEFQIGNKNKNRTIALNAKLAAFGGGHYTPIDLESSIEADEEVLDMTKYNSVRADEVIKLDFAISYRRDRAKTTHELKIDIQNITNNQAIVDEYYDNREETIDYIYQWSVFPNVIYTINF